VIGGVVGTRVHNVDTAAIEEQAGHQFLGAGPRVMTSPAPRNGL